MKNEYFIEKSYKIDKLMWMFFKSDSVKQKKQIFCVKQMKSFPRADVNALSHSQSFFFLESTGSVGDECYKL